MLTIYEKRENARLSEHFNQHEFDCKCKYPDCTYTLIDHRVLINLEELRSRTGEPVIITSGYRCQMHNIDVGGVRNSFHKRAKAVDIVLPTGYAMNDYIQFIKKCGFNLIIPYEEQDFVHCQIASIPEAEKFLEEFS